MASSFGFISMLLLLVCVFFSPSYARRERNVELKRICSRTSHHHLCLKLLRSDSRTNTDNLRELTRVAIDLALTRAKRIHSKLDSRSEYKGQYGWEDKDGWDDRYGRGDRFTSCAKNYNDAIRDLELARRLLDSGDYSRIPVQVRDALEEVSDCRNRIKKLRDGYGSSHLSKLNKEFEVLIDVAKVASESLYNYKDSDSWNNYRDSDSWYNYKDWGKYKRGKEYYNYKDWNNYKN